MAEREAVSREHICTGLEELGVRPGDLLLVHSSLSSFGRVEGGARTVIEALLQTVGPQGTVMVPTLTFQILQERPYRFSVRETPSSSGRVTEVLRQHPQAHRSCHPVSSAAAVGRRAEQLTRDHLDTPCGLTSPYYRLAELGGKVVFFGVSMAANSLFHCAEEIAEPPYLGYVAIPEAQVILPDGGTLAVTARRYDCADRGIRRYLANMEPIFRAQGLLDQRFIGTSRTVVMDGWAGIECSVQLLHDDPAYLLTEKA